MSTDSQESGHFRPVFRDSATHTLPCAIAREVRREVIMAALGRGRIA
jgi:hypothetical protein